MACSGSMCLGGRTVARRRISTRRAASFISPDYQKRKGPRGAGLGAGQAREIGRKAARAGRIIAACSCIRPLNPPRPAAAEAVILPILVTAAVRLPRPAVNVRGFARARRVAALEFAELACGVWHRVCVHGPDCGRSKPDRENVPDPVSDCSTGASPNEINSLRNDPVCWSEIQTWLTRQDTTRQKTF